MKESYPAYVVHIEQTAVWLYPAKMPNSYLEELCNGAALGGNLKMSC